MHYQSGRVLFSYRNDNYQFGLIEKFSGKIESNTGLIEFISELIILISKKIPN